MFKHGEIFCLDHDHEIFLWRQVLNLYNCQNACKDLRFLLILLTLQALKQFFVLFLKVLWRQVLQYSRSYSKTKCLQRLKDIVVFIFVSFCTSVDGRVTHRTLRRWYCEEESEIWTMLQQFLFSTSQPGVHITTLENKKHSCKNSSTFCANFWV